MPAFFGHFTLDFLVDKVESDESAGSSAGVFEIELLLDIDVERLDPSVTLVDGVLPDDCRAFVETAFAA